MEQFGLTHVVSTHTGAESVNAKERHMAKIKPSYNPLDLKGSEQHHDLKNQPGEKGEKDHQEKSDITSEELEKTDDEEKD